MEFITLASANSDVVMENAQAGHAMFITCLLIIGVFPILRAALARDERPLMRIALLITGLAILGMACYVTFSK